MPTPRELLPALTPLRFPAALAAVWFHVWCTEAIRLPDGPPPPLRLWHLWGGLSFFFVLSGFILAHNYLDEFRRPTGRGVWNFLAARLSRVYPVHLLALLLMVPIHSDRFAAGEFGPPALVVLLQLGFGIAFVPMDYQLANAFNSPAWSLSAEWFFYLTLPLLVPALASGPLRRRAAVVAVALVPWAAAVGLWAAGAIGPMVPFRFPPVRLFDFVAGVLLAVYWHRPRAPGAAAPGRGRAALEELAAVAFAGAWFWALVKWAKTPDVMFVTGWIGVHVPPFAALTLVLARGTGPLARLLATRVPTYLGDISFALYMLHMPVINYFVYFGHRVGFPGWSWPVRCAAVLGASLGLAAACYHLYELPVRDRLRRAISFRRPKPAAAAPPPGVPARRAA